MTVVDGLPIARYRKALPSGDRARCRVEAGALPAEPPSPERHEPVPWPGLYLTNYSAGIAPNHGTCCGPGIPTMSHGGCTLALRAPLTPGTRTFTLWTAGHSHQHNATNNRISLTCKVDHLA
ncbi:hypothetical protein ACFPIJ_31670 [Dactylosporangium cerinum]|uniref:Uncharacterized protein n=1 Tax=Dactylosporangium cerinum TaxID=1434730 RepID=A0ABV9W460_9ACTN